MCAAPQVPDVLAKILDRKKDEVEALKSQVSADSAHPIAKALETEVARKKAFYNSLNLPKGSLTVIAEIKRKSPSRGVIGTIKDPAVLSRVYNEGGAGAISVLTDFEGFGGTMEDLIKVVKTQQRFKGNYPGPCPVLRKDFIIDEIQIAEAAVGGASAVLLIVAALGKDRTKQLLDATHAMGLDALVEVHDEDELQIALDVGADIVGVNNRDLRTFNVSLDTSFRLAPLIPEDVIKIAESGITDCLDAWKLRDAGFNAILVGETLVTAYEGSAMDSTSYSIGYNQAKGIIKAFKAKGSVEFGNSSMAAFFGKGEGAKETLGELSI
ncbi:Indole-3-glycerol phosphate synthase [Gracilariopsis chorda]|uniref:indole-3-glycerol-phosphate synthase n=1 Tax=Gracilariopsis chorda TaxID=448386 RepID=A0A2V3IDN5_9FLOR|nr:Indole-3-glycerol phosphate synthase [Gracilariopsis chorda]|eukprot:PXF40177.1 Indole-3-glycerol phosphate synthase [Gracilariopsis chorda]